MFLASSSDRNEGSICFSIGVETSGWVLRPKIGGDHGLKNSRPLV